MIDPNSFLIALVHNIILPSCSIKIKHLYQYPMINSLEPSEDIIAVCTLLSKSLHQSTLYKQNTGFSHYLKRKVCKY